MKIGAKAATRLVVGSVLVLFAGALQAEVIKIPVGQQTSGPSMVSKPTLGMSKTMVVEQFGEPEERFEAVGTPPITRWHYPEFTVYFEHDTVMHSVVIHQPSSEIEN